jgi:oligosaccharide translocation protein RFT1
MQRQQYLMWHLSSTPKFLFFSGTINLVWMVVPVGVLSSMAFGYVWLNVLELPAQDVDQYHTAVVIICVNALIVLTTEPFYIVGQVFLHVKFRSAVDLFYLCLNTGMQCLVVTLWPEKAILYNACAGLVNSSLFLAIHVGYFWMVLRQQQQRQEVQGQEPLLPFASVGEFLPSVSQFRVDLDRWRLSLSFFKQGFLKQILTEGEKYMFTWFSLMTLPQQGVYDVIANLGSIPARLFFSKLEESAHLYFSQTVTRGEKGGKEVAPTRHLHLLLKGLVLLGLVVCTFGVSYSHLLLHLYGGELLSSGEGPSLLRMHCFYVMFLAVNGVSECYAFCAMTHEQVARYNYLMAAMTATFLCLTWLFAKAFGPVGFIVANCCNFAMRIAHNFVVIQRRHSGRADNPLKGLLPTTASLSTLVAAGVACQFSERHLYRATLATSAAHVVCGGVAFTCSMAVIAFKEPWLRNLLDGKSKRS